MKHEIQPFGKTKDGQEVKVHTLTNLKGVTAKIIDYGATLIGLETPDRNGKKRQCDAGVSDVGRLFAAASVFWINRGPLCQSHCEGAVHAGWANLQIATNNGPNHLHGGNKGLMRWFGRLKA